MDKDTKDNQVTGAEALLLSLAEEGVDTIFGYPGGQVMAVYDRIPDHSDSLRHILVRHEQGAIHAAQGYARVKGTPGVVLVTSGPGRPVAAMWKALETAQATSSARLIW